MLYEDRSLDEQIADARWMTKLGALPTVTCVLYGVNNSSPCLVLTPVDPAPGHPPRYVDVLYEAYVNVFYNDPTHVRNMDETVSEIDAVPGLIGLESTCAFAVYTSNGPFEPRNRLIAQLEGAEGVVIRGAVLVAKFDRRSGAVVSVTPDDMTLVDEVLVRVLKASRPVRLADGGVNQLGLIRF